MKRIIIILLTSICMLKVANAQNINFKATFKVMKDYYYASSEMMKNHQNGIVAKNVKVYFGKNTSEIEYYRVFLNKTI